VSGRHDGRVAVVTGGANGIGRAYGLRLAAEGATVAILDLADGADVIAQIEADGGKALAVRVDLADRDAVEAARDQVDAAVGPAPSRSSPRRTRRSSPARRSSPTAVWCGPDEFPGGSGNVVDDFF
jgi:NAD(P)-dependent dehydrogenase (short-subunit alcohol dehydrogenase family)